jgi:hypothetical protein
MAGPVSTAHPPPPPAPESLNPGGRGEGAVMLWLQLSQRSFITESNGHVGAEGGGTKPASVASGYTRGD